MKFKILIGLFMMFGVVASMNAQSFMAPEDAVAAIDQTVGNVDSQDIQFNSPSIQSQDQVSAATAVTDENLEVAVTRFLVELKGSIKEANDTQTGYDELVARLTPGAGTPLRLAVLDAAKNFALETIAN